MMRFNILMGTGVVPLLARLVLCAAFLPMGWNKLVNDHTFRGDDAKALIELGVVEQPTLGGAVGQPAALQSFFDRARERAEADERADDAGHDKPNEKEQESRDDDEKPARERMRDVADQVEETVEDVVKDLVQPTRGVITTDPATGEPIVIARRMHTVTLIVHRHNGPSPVIMGWLATLTELVGGTLLLVGLFARVWGIALAVTMVVAFYLTSWPILAEAGPFAGLFSIAADMTGGYADFNRMYAQLALFVLAFGVFLTGAGPVSLDRWLFRASTPPVSDDD